MSDASSEQRYEALRDGAALPDHVKRLEKFGRNEHGYDLGGDDGQGTDDLECEDYGDGSPGRSFARNTILTWAKLWDRFDVATAASVFNFDPELVAGLAITDDDWQRVPLQDYEFGRLVQMVASQRIYERAGAKRTLGTPIIDQFYSPTCAEVAALLNVSEANVIQAVKDHYWMALGEERDGSREIEHDGE